MELRKATRQKTKLRIGLAGPSGSGKTYSALLLASGVAPWEKIALIDTENGSGDLYSHLGGYNVITLTAPFTPERYIEAIKTCEDAGMEVIVIDSITHEWDGKGGLLEVHSNMSGNSYTNWNRITPRHNAFIQAILQSKCHVLTTVRKKQDYDMVKDGNGKLKPVKVGLKEVTREGFEYELTLNFEIDMSHNVTTGKDRTGLFVDKPDFVITPETGKTLREWCESGAEPIVEKPVVEEPVKEKPKAEKKVSVSRILTKIKKVSKLEDLEDAKAAVRDVLSKVTPEQKDKLIEALRNRKGELLAEEADPSNDPNEFGDAPEPQKKKAKSQSENEKLLKLVKKGFAEYAKYAKWDEEKLKAEVEKIIDGRTADEIGEVMLTKYVEAIEKRIEDEKKAIEESEGSAEDFEEFLNSPSEDNPADEKKESILKALRKGASKARPAKTYKTKRSTVVKKKKTTSKK
jgi:hypothetical protein